MVLVKCVYKRNGRRWDQKVSRGLVCRAKKPVGIRVQDEWWGVRCPSQRAGGHQGEVKSQPCRDCCSQATQEPEPGPGLSRRCTCSGQGPTSPDRWA